MCDVLNAVTQTVREVVAGVDAPLVTSHRVLNVLDPACVGGGGVSGKYVVLCVLGVACGV